MMDEERVELSRCLLVPEYHIHGEIREGWPVLYRELHVACRRGLPWLFEATVAKHFGRAYMMLKR